MRLAIIILAYTCVVTALPVTTGATTYIVPDSYATIDSAVQFASDLDTVLVRPGTYVETVSINKEIVLMSTDGSGATTIQGPLPAQDALTLSATGVVVSGFTLTGGQQGLTVTTAVSALSINDCVVIGTGAQPVHVPAMLVEDVLSGVTLVPNASGEFNAVLVEGQIISLDTTWPWPIEPAAADSFTYQVVHNTRIRVRGASSPTLTLESGAVVKHSGTSYWYIGEDFGALDADSAVFTSAKDDTLGDATGDQQTEASPGDWLGIWFWDKTVDESTQLTGCVIRYVGIGFQNPAVRIFNSSPTIDGCHFEHNSPNHLWVDDDNSDPVVIGCTFRDHGNVTFPNQIRGALRLPPRLVEKVLRPSANNTLVANTSDENNVVIIQEGTVDQSTTWPWPISSIAPDKFTYLVATHHQVNVHGNAAPVLTLQPGTVIKHFGGNTFWSIGESGPGGLVADGVLFTSAHDDTLGSADGVAGTPAAGNWNSIRFGADAVVDSIALRGCEFRYAGIATPGSENFGMVNIDGVPVVVEDCVFRSSASAGLGIDGSSVAPPVVARSVFVENLRGLSITNDGDVQGNVFACCFVGNTEYGLFADATREELPVNAQGCWWGDASGPSGVGPGTGDAVSDYVFYVPWRTVFDCASPTGIVDEAVSGQTRAMAPFPNPFNPTVTIPYELASPGRVTIRIFDVRGALVRTIVNRSAGSGRHRAVWRGRNDAGEPVSTGVYFARFEASGIEQTRKLVLLK